MKKVTLFILCFFTLTCFSLKRNVPGTYSTIQLGLNACNVGDTVLVQPGTYPEHIVWPNINNIKLFSAGDSSNTIIDASLNGRCITITPSVGVIDSTIIIKGFKLTRGYSDTASFTGIAIYVINSPVKLLDVAICKNTFNALNAASIVLQGPICYFGNLSFILNSSVYSNTVNINNITTYGALLNGRDFYYSNNLISNNLININFSAGFGYCGLLAFQPNGGILNFFAKTKLIENKISVINSTSGADISGGLINMRTSTTIYSTFSNILAVNNSFSVSSTSTVQALFIYNYMNGMAATTIEHCTFADNSVSGSPKINATSVFLYGYFTTASTTCAFICKRTIDIINSILWNPSIPSPQEVAFVNNSGSLGGTTSLTATNSDINSYTAGINCINQNPQFISITDHHLLNSSPCINSGTNTTISTDLDGNPRPNPIGSFPDMGCYESSNQVGINEIKTSTNSFEIYPNPTTGEFILRSKYPTDNSYFELYNINGQLIEKKGISEENTNINLKEFSNGLYFLKISNKEKGSEAIKIIKQ